MDVPVLHGLLETMHAALGQSRLLGDASHALSPIVTEALENPQAFVPKSHVGLFSGGWLNSWRNPAPQSTRPTPNCPALSEYPSCLLGPAVRWLSQARLFDVSRLSWIMATQR